MSDRFSKKKRSEIMSRIKSRDTEPELKVRRILHGMGYRYRLHDPNLPGNPDIVLTRHRKVIFVHGCFWHGHKNCSRSNRPASNKEFWHNKINSNIQRDEKTKRRLKRLGWKVLSVWQCQTRDAAKLENRLQKYMKD